MSGRALSLAAFAAIVIVAATPLWAAQFTITLLNYIGVYALVVLGIVLLTGVGGLTSFGQAAFVGIGAYATGWLTTVHGASPWLGLLFALVVTAAVAALLGAVTLRLGGHFLPLGTIAWGLSIYYLFGNMEALGGHNGMTGVPPIWIGSFSLEPNAAIYYLIWAMLALAMLAIANLLQSREGRAIRSLRGGAVMVESLGINVFRVRLITFVIAALLAAVSGWLYAHMSRFVSPAPFDVRMGIDYLFMAILGGSGQIFGAVAGSALVTLLSNALQDLLPHLSSNGQQLQAVFFAIVYVLALQFARGGIMPLVLRYLPRRARSLPRKAVPLPRRKMPEPGQPLLRVDGLVKRFGGLEAVSRVGFAVSAGEIVALIGPNGAGKSTLFNLITGALRADAGTVSFLGSDITRANQRRIASRRHCAHIPACEAAAEHVVDRQCPSWHLPAHPFGFCSPARCGLIGPKRRVRGSRRCVSSNASVLAPMRTSSPAICRLAASASRSRARARDRSGADHSGRAGGGIEPARETLAGRTAAGAAHGRLTVLLVEHDVEFVMTLVDRIVVMDFGSKLVEGEPAAIRADPRVQEAYLGSVA